MGAGAATGGATVLPAPLEGTGLVDGPTGTVGVGAEALFDEGVAPADRPGISWDTTPTMTAAAAIVPPTVHRNTRRTRAKTSRRCASICACCLGVTTGSSPRYPSWGAEHDRSMKIPLKAPCPLGTGLSLEEAVGAGADRASQGFWVGRTDIVMKSLDHHGSKYRPAPPVMLERSSVPLARLAAPAGVEGE